MGQHMACCFTREQADLSDRRPSRTHGKETPWDLADLQEAVQALELEKERLMESNGRLLQKNTGLQRENSLLKQELAEHEAERQWEPFDILEEHYRQLDHHRSCLDHGVPADGDEAAGSPVKDTPRGKSFFPSPRRPTPRDVRTNKGVAAIKLSTCSEYVPLSPRACSSIEGEKLASWRAFGSEIRV
mmetsp:Transcript_17681/g.40982  ORF Transcript_17681/g.40982 Transcript_17681/m.40982 type:complete len:187 (-) Transcript_17681:96-656(-)